LISAFHSQISVDIDELKGAYGANKAVKAICDEMASRGRNQNDLYGHSIVSSLLG